MMDITLDDILIKAHNESYGMQHFYIGVEHLFIAMLAMRGSILRAMLQEQGVEPDYVTNAIRQKVGKGSRDRQWAGMIETPRTQHIVRKAKTIAQNENLPTPTERQLLAIILNDPICIPYRVLRALQVDVEVMADEVFAFTKTVDTQPVNVEIDYADDELEKALNPHQRDILRRMFYGYARVRVERRLTGGYTSAVLLAVTPIRLDTSRESMIVAKIDRADNIQDEAQRYEQHVKGVLPAMTARLEDKPTVIQNNPYAGLKYTLVAGANQEPSDLRRVLHDWPATVLGHWLHRQLFNTFQLWWKQSKPFIFPVWREYDWLLPPILTLQVVKDDHRPPDYILRFPIRRARLMQLDFGNVVSVENFAVRKIDADRGILQLGVGVTATYEKPYKVEVRGIDLDKHTYYRGEIIERLTGYVYDNRHQQLINALQVLRPDFDIEDTYLTGTPDGAKFPNPLKVYNELLDREIRGFFSKIHGDMHLGNVMVGPNKSAFLIDFGRTRDGHTLFDWVSLEVSILSELVMPLAGEDWMSARRAVSYLVQINRDRTLPTDSPLADAFAPILQVRYIAEACLAKYDDWSEYYIALALAGLRAMTWRTMPIPSRRLMFLTSALAMNELSKRRYIAPDGKRGTPSPEDTDINTTI